MNKRSGTDRTRTEPLYAHWSTAMLTCKLSARTGVVLGVPCFFRFLLIFLSHSDEPMHPMASMAAHHTSGVPEVGPYNGNCGWTSVPWYRRLSRFPVVEYMVLLLFGQPGRPPAVVRVPDSKALSAERVCAHWPDKASSGLRSGSYGSLDAAQQVAARPRNWSFFISWSETSCRQEPLEWPQSSPTWPVG